MARHRRVVLLAWALVLLVCAALYPSLHEVLSEPDNAIDNSQSAQAERMLQSPGFRGAGGEQDAIVFYSAAHRAGDAAFRDTVARVLRAARSSPGAEHVVSPYPPAGLAMAARGPAGAAADHTAAGARAVAGARAAAGTRAAVVAGGHAAVSAPRNPAVAAGGHAAVAHVALGGSMRERFKDAEIMQKAVARASGSGVHAWLTGFSALSKDLASTETADSERGESIGVPLAFAVLVVALGAVGAALMPLLLAGAGVLLTSGVIALLARLIEFDVFLLTVVTMIGVGIGIDYSLFIVSRFREELARQARDPRRERRRISHAVGVALATSGRTILYSGAIVALSLTSLLAVRAPIFREFAIGAAVTVACTLAAALTLLPAALAQLGSRVDAGLLPRRMRPADTVFGASSGDSGWARWARAMMRRPLAITVGVLALLLLAITPVTGLKSGIALDIPSLSQTPSGKGAQVLAHSFSAGMTAPLEIVLVRRHGEPERSALLAGRTLAADLRSDRQVSEMSLGAYPDGALLTVSPSVPIDSNAAQRLVQRIRMRMVPPLGRRHGVSVLVGGWPAQSLDASRETTDKLPVVLAITLGIALVFLLVVLRSLVLPLKAVAMNLLATGATLGLVVLVFQEGHGESLLGFSSPGFIQAYLPLCMFVLLFGLSMDYEIFLIRRMQETWHETADNGLSVVSGVEHTGRPISAAAAIMVVVFGSNVTAHILELKQFGFALAVAIAIDATLVRLVLVPAFMCLLGERNWWLPSRLSRLLPRVDLH